MPDATFSIPTFVSPGSVAMNTALAMPGYQNKLQSQELANKIAQAKAAVAPQMAHSALAYQHAQTARLNAQANSPFGGSPIPGAAGQAVAMGRLKKEVGVNSPIYQNALRIQDYKENYVQVRRYQTLPAAWRSKEIGQAVNLGYSVNEAHALLSRGLTVDHLQRLKKAKIPISAVMGRWVGGPTPVAGTEQLMTAPMSGQRAPDPMQGSPMAAQGARVPMPQVPTPGPSAPLPPHDSPIAAPSAPPEIAGQSIGPGLAANYPATTAAIGQNQKQAQAAAELSPLTKFVANSGLQYGGIGTSLIGGLAKKMPLATILTPWYQDATSSSAAKQKKAVDYLAAHALAPEMSGIRMRMQGAQGGIGTIEALGPTVIGNIKTDLAQMPAAIQQRVQRVIEQQLAAAVQAGNRQLVSGNPNILKSTSVSAPREVTQKPLRKTWSSRADFVKYYRSLTPPEKKELMIEQKGGVK